MTGGELAWRAFRGFAKRPVKETRDAWRALDPSEQQAWEDVARAVFEETMFAVRLTLVAQLNDSLDALG